MTLDTNHWLVTRKWEGYRTSPSQISSWELCPRIWGFDKLDRVPREEQPYHRFGTNLHQHAEDYLTTAHLDMTTVEGRLFVKGIHLLPAPGTPGMQCETPALFMFGENLYHGSKDVEIHTPGQRPIVMDHKTCSSWQWMKSEAELRTDPQVVIYSVDSMLQTGYDSCDIKYTYWNKKIKTDPVRPVHFTVTKDKMITHLSVLDETTNKIRAVVEDPSITTANQLPYNTLACDKFGGCKYEPICNIPSQERFSSIMSDFFKNVQALQNQGTPAQPQAPHNPNPMGQALHQPVAEAPVLPQAPQMPLQPPAPMPQAQPVMQAPAPMPQPQPQAQAPAVMPPAEPKRRGRRSKEEVAREKGFVLFVDCAPIHGVKGFDLFAHRVERINAAIQQQFGGHWSAIDHGKGRGVFLQLLSQDLETNVQVNPLYVSTRSRDESEALTTLMGKACEVYRAS